MSDVEATVFRKRFDPLAAIERNPDTGGLDALSAVLADLAT